jgi:flagellin
VNSIVTNVGAAVALQNLNHVNSSLDVVQNRVSTGLKVNSAVDDASSFAIAQGTRGNLKAYSAVSQGISNARGVSAVALAGMDSFVEIWGDLKKKIIEGMNPGNTTEQQSLLEADYQNMLADARNVLQGASYNGTNILIEIAIPFNLVVGSVNDVNVIANIDGSSFTLRGQRIDLYWALQNVENISTTANAQTALTTWETNFSQVMGALGQLGADRRTLEAQDQFISRLADATTEGLGAIVDADMAKESARLIAFQTQQQLSVQTLSIANARPKVLLDLFN